jgi:nitrogen fixation protein NifT
MPNVMIRENPEGKLTFYIAKKDLEDNIASIEFDQPDKWGGTVKLANGGAYYIEPLAVAPKLPITLRAKRVGDEDD